jgi:glutamyl-tRNA reductase
MSLLVLGLNHRTAPVEVREKVVFDGSRMPQALAELRAFPGVQEGVIVSTCNRTELYCAFQGAEPPRVTDWLERFHGTGHDLANCTYELHGPAAVEHVFAVAAGLDSLIIGEPQILGQLKDAYRSAQQQGTAGPTLNRLFQSTFAVAKRVRTETRIGASAVSVASAAVQLARRIFAGFERHTALLVGAGEMIELAARHLHAQGLGRMIIANRTLGRAQDLAGEFKASAISLDALVSHLPQADIVISSTASPVPVISYEATLAAIAARRRRPMFMVDIAVPRDIEARVAEIEDVYLYTIDDLRQVVDENLKARHDEANEARSLIAEEVQHFMAALKTLDVAPAIRELRTRAESTKAQTLEQARRLLAAGKPPDEALQFLANTLTNRLLHAPSSALREAAEKGDAALVDAAHRLYDLDDEQA